MFLFDLASVASGGVGDAVAIDEGGDGVEAWATVAARAVLARAAAMAGTVLAAVVGSAWAVVELNWNGSE